MALGVGLASVSNNGTAKALELREYDSRTLGIFSSKKGRGKFLDSRMLDVVFFYIPVVFTILGLLNLCCSSQSILKCEVHSCSIKGPIIDSNLP